MKKMNIIAFSFMTLVSLNIWGAASFTNIASVNERLVVAGVKNVEPGMEMLSHLVEIDSTRMSSRKIRLPREIDSREIVGLLPSQKDFVLVVTQLTRGGGDKPQIHSYDTSRNVWRKVGEVDCVSFSKVVITNTDMEFSCEVTDDEGKVSQETKRISSVVSLSPNEVSLPVTKIDTAKMKASLEGQEFEWNKLKVTLGSKEKVFTP